MIDNEILIPSFSLQNTPDNFYHYILEEVLKDDHALWWSKDGIYIVYAQFNDTVVRKYSYPFYGTKNKNYAEIRQVAYPKVSVSARNGTIHIQSNLPKRSPQTIGHLTLRSRLIATDFPIHFNPIQRPPLYYGQWLPVYVQRRNCVCF